MFFPAVLAAAAAAAATTIVVLIAAHIFLDQPEGGMAEVLADGGVRMIEVG